MTVGEYIRRVSRRQHNAHLAWLQGEWNRPGPTEHYLMAILSYLASIPAWVWGKDAEPRASDHKMVFDFARPRKPGEEFEEDEAEGTEPDDFEAWLAYQESEDMRPVIQPKRSIRPPSLFDLLEPPPILTREDVERLTVEMRKAEIDANIRTNRGEL